MTVFILSLAAGLALLMIYMKSISTGKEDFWPACIITAGVVLFLICLF